jgi:ribulose-5-phosphate 4-epimerase/fuculose-1-phosphate aldolase
MTTTGINPKNENVDTRDIRVKIAKSIRMLENIGLLDMNGHLSYRIPGKEMIFINSRKAGRATLMAKDITLVDLEGNLLEGLSEPPSEFHIHTSIYRKRPDVLSVLHNHPHWQTVLGIAGKELEAVFSIGSFAENIPTFEDSSLINTKAMGDRLSDCLGEANMVNIRHHGSVVVGENIQEVFARCIFMEENAKKQYHAALLGSYQPLSGENLTRTRDTNWSPKIVQKIWDYHEEKANRDSLFLNIESE